MMRRLSYLFLSLIVCGQLAIAASDRKAASDADWEGLAFRIEDSRAFVGIAPVYLSVSKLKPVDGNLVGTYSITVPLRSSSNDEGKIVLPLDSKVSDIGTKGGTLTGKAHSSSDEGVVNKIVCVILPEKDQGIELAITTKDRTLNFRSRYTIVEPGSEI